MYISNPYGLQQYIPHRMSKTKAIPNPIKAFLASLSILPISLRGGLSRLAYISFSTMTTKPIELWTMIESVKYKTTTESIVFHSPSLSSDTCSSRKTIARSTGFCAGEPSITSMFANFNAPCACFRAWRRVSRCLAKSLKSFPS